MDAFSALIEAISDAFFNVMLFCFGVSLIAIVLMAALVYWFLRGMRA